MIPVQQTKTGPLRGDCLAACVASIFEVPVEAVPKLEPEDWSTVLRAFLKLRGFGLVYLQCDSNVAAHAPEGYAILCLEHNADGRRHCVVAFNGEVIWDPWPGPAIFSWKSRPYLFINEYWLVFTVLNPAELVKKQ